MFLKQIFLPSNQYRRGSLRSLPQKTTLMYGLSDNISVSIFYRLNVVSIYP